MVLFVCFFFCQQEQEIRKIGALIVEGTMEGFDVPRCSDFTDKVTVEVEPGTSGGNKLWLGKDYSNPITRDFFDVHRPYDGMLYLKAVFSGSQ